MKRLEISIVAFVSLKDVKNAILAVLELVAKSQAKPKVLLHQRPNVKGFISLWTIDLIK